MLDLIISYKYIVLLPLAIAEGPIVSVVAGYLARMDYLLLSLTVMLLVLADIISDLIYYFLGKYSARNKKVDTFIHGKFLDNKVTFFKKLWDKHLLTVMFFGKLSYGISVPIIISAGIVNLPLKNFLLYSVPVSIFQTTCYVLLGYGLGETYYKAIPYMKYPALFVACMFVVVFISVYYLKVKTREILVP